MRDFPRRIVLVFLATVSMVFPVYFLSLIAGVETSASDLVIGLAFVIAPMTAMGVLLLWTVRGIRNAEHLGRREQVCWYLAIALTGPLAAAAFLWFSPHGTRT